MFRGSILGVCCSIFWWPFDDNKNFDDHVKHLWVVFETLWEAKLYAKLKKSYFCQENVVFLGYIISSNGVMVDEETIKVNKD